jgi:hypothetical protein
MGELELQVPEALRAAYVSGSVGFDGRVDQIWKGPAVRCDTQQESTLSIDAEEISFGGMLRKWRARKQDVVHRVVDGDILELTIRGEEEAIAFQIRPMDLTAHLRSGNYTVTLGAAEVCRRLDL